MFAASKTATPSGGGPDAQFNYVTMLLHGDGTNGAQNNTFLDSSTNNFSITRNGNTTQGSFSPYGSNWSNFFDGSGDYLTVPNNAALNLGSSDFTAECWVYLTAYSASYSGNYASFLVGKDKLNAREWFLQISGTASSFTGLDFIGFQNNSTPDVVSGSYSFALNNWYHCAVTRSGNTVRIFVNGNVIQTDSSFTTTIQTTSTPLTVGAEDYSSGIYYYTNGYISNLRVVKGTALYTSNFTPSTTPLTAVSGTSLLTCQSNRFIDNSANAFAVTPSGNPSVQRFNPFGTSTAYSTSVIGGSGYFDGSGDYLNTANSSAFAFGTGNFTVECWINTGSNNVGLAEVDGGSTGYWMWHINAGTMSWQNTRGGANLFLITGAGAVCDNAWHHLAIVRNSSVTKAYWDGVEKASASDTTNYSGTGGNLNVAYESAAGKILNGYMANFRIVKGTAVYTAAFTPPTAPLTAVTNTSILLNTVNAGIFDNAMMNDLETVGNAQISTSVVKYGTGSLRFDGSGDRLDGPATVNMAFGTGDYTIEFWCYPSNTGYGCFIDTRSANPSTNGVSIFNNGTALEIYGQGAILTASGAFTLNTWQFFALTRSGTSLKAFVNGTQVGSTVTNSDNQTAGRVKIGDNVENLYSLNGYIDDLRITKGYARYTANFTPPTKALSDTGPI